MFHRARRGIGGFATPEHVEFPVERSARLIARILNLIARQDRTYRDVRRGTLSSQSAYHCQYDLPYMWGQPLM